MTLTPAPITPRQAQILRMWCSGKSAKEIAHALGISWHTVKHTLGDIRRRAGTRTGPQLGVWAVQHGYVGVSRGAQQ
jgi:DNA-binding CsgD family transcriptional regulator